MSRVISLAAAELAAALGTPACALGLAALTAAFGVATAFGERLAIGQVGFHDFLAFAPWAFAVAAPAWAAWRFGCEAESGMAEAWLAAPIPALVRVLGKWLAGVVAALAALIAWLPVAGVLGVLGAVDAGAGVAAFLGAWLAAAAYLAIAAAAAAGRRTALGAWLAALAACLAFTVFGAPLGQTIAAAVFGPVAQPLAAISAPVRLEAAALGVVAAADVIYFLALSAAGVAIAALALDARRERFA